VLETTLWLNLCKGKLAGVWGRGIAPSPEKFSILSLKMATYCAFWVLAHAAREGGMASPPLGSAS